MTDGRRAARRREAAGPLGRPGPLLLGLGAAILAFLALPTFVVLPISFSSAMYLSFPPPGWSLQWYERYFGSAAWMSATWRSLQVALLTMVVATVLGTAAALALRRHFRGKPLVRLLITAPLIVPVIITAIAIYGLYAQLRLIGTVPGLVLAHTVLALTFVVVVVGATLRGFDDHPATVQGALRRDYTAIVPLLRSGDNAEMAAFLARPRDVRLTIDAALQRRVVDILSEAVAGSIHPSGGSAVVIGVT